LCYIYVGVPDLVGGADPSVQPNPVWVLFPQPSGGGGITSINGLTDPAISLFSSDGSVTIGAVAPNQVDFTIPPPPTETLLSADNSVATQSIIPGAPVPVLHYNTTLSNLITPVGPPPYSQFQVTNSGVYKLLYSIQFEGTSNGQLAVWVVVNGNPVANSSTYTAFKNGDEGIITCEYIVSLNANDVWEWNCEAVGGSVDLAVIPATPSIPLAPSIITNAYRLR
jgi:hypothetical protein